MWPVGTGPEIVNALLHAPHVTCFVIFIRTLLVICCYVSNGAVIGASLTKDKSPQFFSKRLCLFGIALGAKAFREIEEGLFLLLLSLDALFNEFHQDTVIT